MLIILPILLSSTDRTYLFILRIPQQEDNMATQVPTACLSTKMQSAYSIAPTDWAHIKVMSNVEKNNHRSNRSG